MRRSLMVAACLAALAVPALAPAAALAQDAHEGRGRGHAREGRSGSTPRSMPESGSGDVRSAPQPTPRVERPARTPDAAPRPDRAPGDGGQRRDRAHDRGGQDRPDRPRGESSRPGRSQGDQGGQPTTQSRPDRPRGDGQRDGWRGDRPQGDRAGRNGGWTRQDRPGAETRPDRDRGDRNGRDGRDGRFGSNDGRRNGGRRDRDGDRREFHNRFNGDQWRRDWNRRHGNDWWRHDRRWNGWTGVRIGFYFAPGYGYYSVPRSYFGQRFYEGQYLPSIFWRYRLDDWRTWGLATPLPNTEWVWVNNDLYLIDSFDGYIVDAIYNVWSW